MKRIALWWRWHGKHLHRDIRHGIKNLWRWFPTIWRDRNWDGHFIFELLAKKLEFQAKHIGDRNWHMNAKRDAEIMRLVVRLIRLNQEDTYAMEYMDYYRSNISFEQTDETGKWFEMHDELLSENLDDYFAKYPRQYKRVMARQTNWVGNEIDITDKKIVAMTIAHENQERCHKLLFRIMEQNIRRWWD
jgi:hypothetical protein